MSALDGWVMAGFLAFLVGYGTWRGRGSRDLPTYLLAGRRMPWHMVALSVMATQASAITFLSTPGQGYADGLRFVQFYFGLPIAMVVLSATAVPLYHRLKVYTAYEFLESRFGPSVRSLAAFLFLVQRGLSAGLTIYAPSLVFSVLLGLDVGVVCVVLGGLVVIYTASGGSRALAHTHFLQFTVVMGVMLVAFALLLRALPEGMGLVDAARLAGHFGKLKAVNPAFDVHDRYNLWSGVIGGFFLQMSYFGADQSQVGRYLTGASVTQSRLGLLFNGLLKVPMQLFILSIGVLVFVFYLFAPPPAFFDPVETGRLTRGPHAAEYRAIEARHDAATAERRGRARELVEAGRRRDPAAMARAASALDLAQKNVDSVRVETVALLKASDPRARTSDTNYVFLTWLLASLPVGLVGLALAAIFAASMSSSASELNALASTTVVDVWKRLAKGRGTPRHEVWVARVATVFWSAFAIAFAEYASRLGSLIEAVNILGSLFYGTILGLFLCAFWLPTTSGRAVFVAAVIAEAAVIACFKLTTISFLWYNAIGCLLVMGVALALSVVWPRVREAS